MRKKHLGSVLQCLAQSQSQIMKLDRAAFAAVLAICFGILLDALIFRC